MAGNPVTRRRVSDVADVEMAGQEDIGAGIGELAHGHIGAADEMFVAMRLGR